ncbi:MAG TPA: serine/threonine-protein kinase [Bacteroidales bacterium]|nr:serine/threonine-protein kinase [Bacteroidales bacterium]
MDILKPGDIFANDYVLVEHLGGGGYSDVWLAQHKLVTSEEHYVAIKIYVPDKGLDKNGIKTFMDEYMLVNKLRHPFLLKANYFSIYKNSPFLILDYCKNGSVSGKRGEMSENDIGLFMQQAASALAYLHKQDPPIIHQDIKPDNFLIDDNGNYLLADFGISNRLRISLTKSMSRPVDSSGTIPYMGPERFGKHPGSTKESDIWSMGATLFELLTENPPFGIHGGGFQKNGAEIPELPETFSPGLCQVIYRCLDATPENRPSAMELEAIADDFLQSGRWPKTKQVKRKNEFSLRIPYRANVKKILKWTFLSAFVLAMAFIIWKVLPTEMKQWENAKAGHSIEAYENFIKQYPETIFRDSAVAFMFTIAIANKDLKESERLLDGYPQHPGSDKARAFLKHKAMEEYSVILKQASGDIKTGISELNTEQRKYVYTENYQEIVNKLADAVSRLNKTLQIKYADTAEIRKEIAPFIKESDDLIAYYIKRNQKDRGLDPGDKTIYNKRLDALASYNEKTKNTGIK